MSATIDKKITARYVFENTKYDIALIKWNPNVITSIHDHPNKGCSVFLLYGEFYF